MDLSELIGRLEAATAGSRELDAVIWKIADPKAFRIVENDAIAFGPREATDEQKSAARKGRAMQLAPRYTTSLDAALTLVPSWAGWHVGADHTGGQCTAEVGGQMRRGEAIITFDTEAKTAPLALCIAALKARQATKP